MDHSPLEHEVITLRAENAALKEQNGKLDAEWREATETKFLELENTIAQQAEAIRLKDVALRVAQLYLDGNCHSHKTVSSALAIQPSPEILQASDERVAEACMNAVKKLNETKYNNECDRSVTWECAIQISSGEWRKYL